MNKRIITKKEYDSLFVKKRVFYSNFYIFYVKNFDCLVYRTAVKRKVGNAVSRNLYKRRMRVILSDIDFKKKIFILGVMLRKNDFNFQKKKKHIEEILQPLIS